MYIYDVKEMKVMKNTTTAKRGRKPGSSKRSLNVKAIPSLIDFSKIEPLSKLDIDPKMLEIMKTGLQMDDLISHESGMPRATNIMVIGDPGVGKTTLLLDYLSAAQNRGHKCLFISCEMQRKQMFKYCERFPQFRVIPTLFPSDYVEYNMKDVIEQALNQGYDLVVIDSIAEVMDGVREDNKWDRKTTESWFVEFSVKMNKGENVGNHYTSFLNIQQVTKGGQFVGSNKLKHLFCAQAEIRKGGKDDNGIDYIRFIKNRNGNADVKMNFQLENNSIFYGSIVQPSSDNGLEERLMEDKD